MNNYSLLAKPKYIMAMFMALIFAGMFLQIYPLKDLNTNTNMTQIYKQAYLHSLTVNMLKMSIIALTILL